MGGMPWKRQLEFPEVMSDVKRRGASGAVQNPNTAATFLSPLMNGMKRRRSDSNRCIKVLQTSPLPLGYGATNQEPRQRSPGLRLRAGHGIRTRDFDLGKV